MRAPNPSPWVVWVQSNFSLISSESYDELFQIRLWQWLIPRLADLRGFPLRRAECLLHNLHDSAVSAVSAVSAISAVSAVSAVSAAAAAAVTTAIPTVASNLNLLRERRLLRKSAASLSKRRG